MMENALAWFSDTDSVLARVRSPARFLSASERARAEALPRDGNRRDFVAAHVLVRLCAAAFTGDPPRALRVYQWCDRCRMEHGPPRLDGRPEVGLSLSHGRGTVAAIAGPRPVGIDVERVATRVGVEHLPARVLTVEELARMRRSARPALTFLRYWVRKESLVKAGRATLDRLVDVDVGRLPLSPPAEGPTAEHSFSGLTLLDWCGPAAQSVGAAVAPTGITVRSPHRPAERRNLPDT